ncbi:MAG TPA: rhodanese-like domain-containing protein, partial [Ktedonobacterales bacterium]|nr:rhodanese-like domain-containing protein [Ktedonobacterales bacterium]
TDEAAFVRYMNESLPERPPNLARIVALNKAAAPMTIPDPQPLNPEDVEHVLGGGTLALDVRSPGNFATGHIPGAVAISVAGSQFPTRAGMVLPPAAQLVLIADDTTQAVASVRVLAVAGFTAIAGYLEGGMSAWQESGRPVELLRAVSVQSLREALQDGTSNQVIDVRDHSEWEEGHIAGARNIPFQAIPEQAATLDRTRRFYLICGSGERSTIAASLLQPRGFTVAGVLGGMDAWNAAGFPNQMGTDVRRE